VAVKQILEPFLPAPRLRRVDNQWAWNYDLPTAIGRVRAFYGNFGVVVRRSRTSWRMAGWSETRHARRRAQRQLLRKRIERIYDIAYNEPSMHECVFSDDRQRSSAPIPGAIAKRLIDYGFHPYTVSFPLIVHGL